MAKSSYQVGQGNIFGRMGIGIGQGLAEQVPKEVDRYRLSQGLQQLEKDSPNLSPMQFLTRSAAIPGMSNEMMRQFGELAKQQGMRSSLKSQRTGAKAQPSQQQAEDPRVAAAMETINASQPKNAEQVVPSGFNSRGEQAKAMAGTEPENPVTEKYLPKVPFTMDQKFDVMDRLKERFPNATFEELEKMASEEETRYLTNPKAWQERHDYIQGREKEAETMLDSQLETSLQKEGKNLYSDLTGDTLLDLKKAMNNDLATNPALSPKQAAEKWRRIGRDFVESKNIVKAQANRSFTDNFSPHNKKETLKNLSVAQKRYAEMGKQREFYNTLMSENKPPVYQKDENGKNILVQPGTTGFGLSKGYAALAAYPRSDGLKDLFKKSDIGEIPLRDIPAYSAGLAKDFLRKKTGNDSILAFTRSLKDKSNFFDEIAFFDYLRENQNKLTPDQLKELQTGVQSMIPTWGDIALFPIFGRSVLHD